MVTIGGYGGSGRSSSVEVIQVEKNQSCFVDSFPYALEAHSATIIPTGILVCGGYSASGFEKRCYEYKKTTGSWKAFAPMTTKRYEFDMKFLNQAVWAIGGLGGSKSTSTLDKYEMHTNVWKKPYTFDSLNTWNTFDSSIPFDVYDHCLTKISDDKLILIGGEQRYTRVSEEMRRQKYFDQVFFKLIPFSFCQE